MGIVRNPPLLLEILHCGCVHDEMKRDFVGYWYLSRIGAVQNSGCQFSRLFADHFVRQRYQPIAYTSARGSAPPK